MRESEQGAIARLTKELEEARAEIAQLRMCADGKAAIIWDLRKVFDITNMQARILNILRTREAPSLETMIVLLYGDKEIQRPEETLRNQISKLRRKLSDRQVQIETIDCSAAYRLSPAMKSRIDALLAPSHAEMGA